MAIHPDIEITKGKSFPSEITIGGIFFHTEHNIFYGWNGENWQALGAYGLHELDPDKGPHTGTLDMEHLTHTSGIDGIKIDESQDLSPGIKERLCIEIDTERILYDDGKKFKEIGGPDHRIIDNDQDTIVTTERNQDKDDVEIFVKGVRIAKFG